MRAAIERPGMRLWLAMAITAAVAALTMTFADGAEAKKKKKAFKPGSYVGRTSQDEPMGFEATKKEVTGLYHEFFSPCNPPIPGCGSTGYAGLTAEITTKRKKGTFKALSPADGYYGHVEGTLKGKKAKGTAVFDATPDPELPALPVSWVAVRCKSPTAPCPPPPPPSP
ncbi:MAG: hypothetical protein ACRDMA_18110 [Solirubrobacterales bacterium]